MVRKMLLSSLGLVLILGLTPVHPGPERDEDGIRAPSFRPGRVENGAGPRGRREDRREELNAGGGLLGKKVELVIGDTSVNPQKAPRSWSAVVTLTNCAVVVRPIAPSPSPRSRWPHRYGIPHRHLRSWADCVTAKGYPEVFRLTVCNSSFTPRRPVDQGCGVQHVAVIGREL